MKIIIKRRRSNRHIRWNVSFLKKILNVLTFFGVENLWKEATTEEEG